MNCRWSYCRPLTCLWIVLLISTCHGSNRTSISRALRQVNGSTKALGQSCGSNLDCFDQNAVCNYYKKCSCRDGYVDNNSPDIIGGRCQASIGYTCKQSSDCHDYFGECIKSKCTCQAGKIFSRGRCLNVCGEMDIRNRVSHLESLQNCSVIEGHLHIVLIDSANANDYNDYSFPDLVEITDYLMLYRVRGLKSLAKLFPNLAIIRGQNLQIGCALIVYEMPDMVDLGLVSLTAMPRGSIRIEKNSKLCYIETVDWEKIATGVPMEDHAFKYNRDIKECVNRCPEGCHKTMGLREEIPRCWSLEYCQKNLGCNDCGDRFCNETTKQCCDNNCLGGCYGPEATHCTACRDVVDYSDPNKPRCAARCSAGFFEFSERRCLSMSECLNFTFYKGAHGKQPKLKLVIPSDHTRPGLCVEKCGENVQDDPTNTSKCIPCIGKCPKVCFGTYIDRVESAKIFKGCTEIQGNLEIGIPHGSQIGKELDENLASIERVSGSIRIHRSNPLLSLHCFKSLKSIGGESLFQDRYALVVMDNLNLQELFLEDVAKNLKLGNGTVLFQYNRKLCYKKIKEFVRQIGHTNKVDQNDISPDNNGDQMPCEVSELNVTILEVSPRMVIFFWTTFKTTDPRHIISYAINYKEAPSKNMSIYASRDACSDDGWKVQDVQPKKDDKGDYMNDLIAGLKPWTQYALYIETLTISRATEGAISKIVYFRTIADVPQSPTNLVIKAKHPGELHVTWGPPTTPNGNITHYEVYWQRRNLDPKEYELRDYCTNPLSSSISIEETEEVKEKEEENKYKEDGQTCQCKKSQRELEKEKNEREMEIIFQNALQNEVFMKRLDKPATTLSPEMIEKSREIRSVLLKDQHERHKYTHVPANGNQPLDLVQPSPTAHGDGHKTAEVDQAHKAELELNETQTNMTLNVKEMMKKENPYYKAVVFDALELVIPNLSYFEDYNVEVIACQDRDPRVPDKAVLCSNKALGVARTLPQSDADTINSSTIEVQLVKNKTQSIYINWKDPVKPNGLVLTYEIEYMKANINNVKAILICITYKEYRDVGKMGHELKHLEPGNYTFRIRAHSLASNGTWSEFLTFNIPDPEEDVVKPEVYVAVIICGLIVVVLITIGVVWFVAKKRFEKEAHTIFSTNPEYPLLVYEPDEWEVERENCELLKELGQGSFGMVYEGIKRDAVTGDSIRVAIKTINNDSSDHERYKFLQEASIMKMFKCHHVVRLIGVVSKGQPALVLMELMPFGDLKNYLRQHRPDEEDSNGKQLPTLRQIMQIAGEIADGMAYLADKKYVHRDLAARNCMVGEDMTVKIGDFGMTRDIYETDYYRKGDRGLLPVRWMAPESLKDGVFTSMSDVWSYGVVLWEMATLAAQPYQGLSNEEVLRYVISGKVMDTPERCPPKLYDLMVKCWRYRQRQRPTFKEIIEILLPDLDKKFKDLSYFFSEENAKYEEAKLQSASNHYHHTEDELEDIDDDDSNRPMNDYVDEANLPMLGVGASNGHSVELQDIFTDNGSYPHYPTHKHVGSAEPCDCPYRETDEGAAAPPVEFNRQSVCSSPNSAIGGSSDGSKDSSKSSNSSYQRMNGLSVANGHVPLHLRTTPC